MTDEMKQEVRQRLEEIKLLVEGNRYDEILPGDIIFILALLTAANKRVEELENFNRLQDIQMRKYVEGNRLLGESIRERAAKICEELFKGTNFAAKVAQQCATAIRKMEIP